MQKLIQAIENTPVPDVTVQSALQEIEMEELSIAMLGFTEEEQEVIYRNMSKRAAALLAKDIESVQDKTPPFVIAEAVESFLQKIIKYSRHYAENEKNTEAYRIRYSRNMNGGEETKTLDLPNFDMTTETAIIESFRDLKTFIQADGTLALEGVEERVDHPVVKKALQLLVEGWEPKIMGELLRKTAESYIDKQRRQLDMLLDGFEGLASSAHLLTIEERLKAHMDNC